VAEEGSRALLVGDRRFIQDGDGSWYTEGPKGAETGERYLRWFRRVTVAGRAGSLDGLDTGRLNRLESQGLQVAVVPNLSGITARLRNLQRARATLRHLIQQHDAVIARMPTQLGVEAIGLALRAKKPVAVDLGGCALDGLRAYGTLKARLFAPIAFWLARDAVARTHWVSYVTQEYLQHRYPGAPGARMIGCSNVDLPAVDEAPLRQRLERLAQDERPLVFGTIGSLHGQFKGVQHALAALGQAKSRLPSFQYRVLGGGDPVRWRALAEQHGLSENVAFEGTLPGGHPVLEWLDEVDIYLQPSLREGVPRALIEAMSRGCPAIASDIAGIPELLAAEVLHGAGDVKRLEALIEAAVAPEFMRTHALRNWERAKDFTGERLDATRDEFWGAFAAEARARQGALGRSGL